MKVEYDAAHDLLYLWLAAEGATAARTETVAPGVHADFDREERLVGIEVLDASEALHGKMAFEVALAQTETEEALTA